MNDTNYSMRDRTRTLVSASDSLCYYPPLTVKSNYFMSRRPSCRSDHILMCHLVQLRSEVSCIHEKKLYITGKHYHPITFI